MATTRTPAHAAPAAPAANLRWGILSTGNIAGSFTQDVRQLPDADIVAVGSRTAEAAQRFARQHEIPRAHGSWAALAADPDVDVVYVATPHSAHHEATALMIDAGKAVLVEKPFTLNEAEARDLVERARAAGTFLMEAMWMRCNPVIGRLAATVAEGRIGDVRNVHADFGLTGTFPPTHRLRAPELGGGALLDLGVYPVSLAHLLLGAPTAIAAWAQLTPEGVDANTGMVFGYDNGATSLLSCSLVADLSLTATITGTEGRITLPRPLFRPEHFTIHHDGAEPDTITEPIHGVGYTHMAAEVMRCLRDGLTESPLVPLADTLAVMRTMDAVRAQIGVSYPSE